MSISQITLGHGTVAAGSPVTPWPCATPLKQGEDRTGLQGFPGWTLLRVGPLPSTSVRVRWDSWVLSVLFKS